MLRQEKINTHGVMLRALGGLGKAVLEAYPEFMGKELEVLTELDWRKSVGNKVNQNGRTCASRLDRCSPIVRHVSGPRCRS